MSATYIALILQLLTFIPVLKSCIKISQGAHHSTGLPLTAYFCVSAIIPISKKKKILNKSTRV